MDWEQQQRLNTLRDDLMEQLGDLLLAQGHLDRQIVRLRSRLAALPGGRKHAGSTH